MLGKTRTDALHLPRGHDAAAKAKFPCRFFKHGKCEKGSKCPYLHRDSDKESKAKKDQSMNDDLTLACQGPEELSATLSSALLRQWRGLGKHRHHTHGFHTRKAVMNPEAVSLLLQLLPGDNAILDPFVGSGTTMIEVMLAGRGAVGYDLSPLAVGITKYHCWRPSPEMLDELRRAVKEVVSSFKDAGGGDDEGDTVHATPSDSEIDDTFTIDRRMALGSRLSWNQVHQIVNKQVLQMSADAAGALWFLLSHEELYKWDDWRRPRSLEWRFIRTARRYIERVEGLARDIPGGTAEAQIYVADATVDQRTCAQSGEDGVVIDGVLTSPPYPGVYDYVQDDGGHDETDGSGEMSSGMRSTGLSAWVMEHADGVHRRRQLEEETVEKEEKEEKEEVGKGKQVFATGSAILLDPLAVDSHCEGRDEASEGNQAGDAGARPVRGMDDKAKRGKRREHLEIGSRQQFTDSGDSAPGSFALRWQADTEAWLLACASQLEPGGRIAMLIGDNGDIDALQVKNLA
jgi:hypothetical protein